MVHTMEKICATSIERPLNHHKRASATGIPWGEMVMGRCFGLIDFTIALACLSAWPRTAYPAPSNRGTADRSIFRPTEAVITAMRNKLEPKREAGFFQIGLIGIA